MKHVRLKVKRVLTFVAVFTVITMPFAFSQTINNDAMSSNIQLSSNYSQPITSTTMPEGDKNNISVFPNPASVSITIQSSQPMHLISVFDMLGRVVKQFQSDQLQAKINLQDLIPGKYFIKIQLKEMNNSFVYSFVKL
jgi:hypothetical protein